MSENKLMYFYSSTNKDIKPTKYKSFIELNLKEELILGLTENGYTVPTPIQEESIPIIQARKSLIARAKNGTGKTAAFVIPLLNEIN
jgi:ATP-dependent RNA helicase DDX6/DHH1